MSTSEATAALTLLTFTLGDETFAADITYVLEIVEYSRITKVPATPEFMPGVINLRNKVVPVVDLRIKVGMDPGEVTPDTSIVLIEVPFDGETTVLGALVDSVREVRELSRDQIEPPPAIGGPINAELVRGIGKHDGDFVIILNVEKVFSREELSTVKAGAEDAGSGEESPASAPEEEQTPPPAAKTARRKRKASKPASEP